MEVRLGGLYELERLARDSPKDYSAVVEVLSAYIRERRQKVEISRLASDMSREVVKSSSLVIPTDVQTALTIIGRRSKEGRLIKTIDLKNLDLSGIRVENLDLSRIDFSRTDFSNSYLFKVYLNFANLRNTNFKKANLVSVIFNDADIVCSDFSEVFVGSTEYGEPFFTNFERAIFAYTIIDKRLPGMSEEDFNRLTKTPTSTEQQNKNCGINKQ